MRKYITLILILFLMCAACTKSLNANLLAAAYEGDKSRVKSLLKSGADVNARSDDKWTPLMWAAYAGHVDTAQVLLDAGADVSVVTTTGYTAIQIAKTEGHEEIVAMIEQAIIEAKMKSSKEFSALDFAGRMTARPPIDPTRKPGRPGKSFMPSDHRDHNTEIRKKSGFNKETIKTGDLNSAELFLVTVRRNDMAAVQQLLSKGADVNAANTMGTTALMFASGYGNVSMVQLLLSRGADINKQSQWGETALMFAAQRDTPRLLRRYWRKVRILTRKENLVEQP